MLLCPDWQQRLRPPNTELGYAACSNWLLPASSPIAVGGVPHPGKSGGTGASSPSAKSPPRRNTKGMHPCRPPWLLMKNGSAQEFDGARILGRFLEYHEF